MRSPHPSAQNFTSKRDEQWYSNPIQQLSGDKGYYLNNSCTLTSICSGSRNGGEIAIALSLNNQNLPTKQGWKQYLNSVKRVIDR